MPLFLLSFLMLFVACSIAAHLLGRNARERFFIFLMGCSLQFATLAIGLSIGHNLTPKNWLIGQAIVLGGWMLAWVIYWKPAGAAAHLRSIPANLSGTARALSQLPVSETAWIVVAGVFCLIGGFRQFYNPIAGFDELGYHIPRVLLWIQEQTVWLKPTNNVRQTVFTIGSELYLLWPRLFVEGETFSRMVFWLHQPLAAIGVGVLAREAGLSRARAMACAAIYAATPTVGTYALSLKSDVWVAVFATAIGFWAVRLCVRSREGATPREVFMLFFALAIAWSLAVSVKPLVVPLLPCAALLIFLLPLRGMRRVAFTGLTIGVLIGLFWSSAGVTFAINTVRDGHPLGPPTLRKIVRPPQDSPYIRTHLARIPVVLFEYPEMPSHEIRSTTKRILDSYMQRTGADRTLPLEENNSWPGQFLPAVKTREFPLYASVYSLAGMFWLPALFVGFIVLIVQIVRTRPNFTIGPIATLTLLGIPALLVPAISIRWMGGGPDRFWIGAYALAIPLIVLVGQQILRGNWLAGVGVLLIIYMLYPSFRHQLEYMSWDFNHKLIPGAGMSYYEASEKLPKSARVLNVGSYNAPDYLLFGPGFKKPRYVVPWGPQKFEPSLMNSIIKKHGITHVIIEFDIGQGVYWDFTLHTPPMVEWLKSQYPEIPLKTPSVRLFEVK